jgi:bifunctional ADP-heptose synthase (sugar kinase/adenylyltransferase)
VADVSGAGDTVVSVVALCLALKIDTILMAELANIAGGMVCEKVGVVPINKEEFLRESIALLAK